jgi:hypothetical protein
VTEVWSVHLSCSGKMDFLLCSSSLLISSPPRTRPSPACSWTLLRPSSSPQSSRCTETLQKSLYPPPAISSERKRCFRFGSQASDLHLVMLKRKIGSRLWCSFFLQILPLSWLLLLCQQQMSLLWSWQILLLEADFLFSKCRSKSPDFFFCYLY